MHCRLWASPSCFLLVTFLLSHRHLALAALLPTRSSSTDYSVAWSSPAPGDRFGSGDTIVGEWRVTPQNQKVVSPSFRLCMGGEDGCGATIWPEVVEESEEGSYYVSLTAPSVITESGYYLQMKDDFGHTFASPIFNIASTPPKKNKPAAHPPDVPQPRPDQAPMSWSPSSSSTGTKSKNATDSDPAAAAPATDPNGGVLSPPSPVASLSPNSAATSSPGGSGNGSGSQGTAASAHNAPPAAAIAVPLSLTGAIILLAGGLALHHRKQLSAEKERASSSWLSSSSQWPAAAGWWNKDGRRRSPRPDLVALDLGGSSRDVEKALLFARGALLHDHDGISFPDRTTHDAVYHDRRFPEKAEAAAAVSSLYPSYAPSSYAYSAPEPRQRTRELDLLTREFTTTRPHPSRTRARPSPSPSSSSYYRGLWDRRYTLRRGTRSSNDNNTNITTNGDGTGSLWRSLSLAASASRHKKVLPQLPVAPPSALNSPAMMSVVTSVTSEVLPSYLPSPQFDGPTATDRAHDGGGRGEHGANVGEFGFENVPLSPPLPPPLHTRGEAADSDDSRMRELRGVYEAVARALGSTHRV